MPPADNEILHIHTLLESSDTYYSEGRLCVNGYPLLNYLAEGLVYSLRRVETAIALAFAADLSEPLTYRRAAHRPSRSANRV